MTRSRRLTTTFAALGLLVVAQGCSDDDGAVVHSPAALRDALLTVDDVVFIPAEWEENMRLVVEDPSPPWENVLDPYLCTEAGTPAALTLDQAQLELTGGSVMETLLSSEDADDLYDELNDAYLACDETSSLPYSVLNDGPAVGDESATYRSSLGVVTVARFGTDLMILKWWIGDFFDQTIQYYPDLVAAAATKVRAI